MSQAHDQHAHEHPPHLAHHWENPRQQFEAGKLGMWLFLATEVLLFGGLFCAYAVWRGNNPDLFRYGSQYLDTKWGAINTAVLILSSLTMAMAVTMAQQNRQKALKICLALTFAGAVGFLGIKYIEYSHKFKEGWFPGLHFYEKPGEASHTWQAHVPLESDAAAPRTTPLAPPPDLTLPPAEVSAVPPAASGPAGLATDVGTIVASHETDDEMVHAEHELAHPLQDPVRPKNAHMFFNIYFMMTGLHGIHVVVGMIVIGWLFLGAVKGRFNHEYFTPVDLGGLYWHVVDLIWIFLFPLFYLI
ncbi:MAG: cytochrome c oxidase subunit 3 family protein [Planctomycetota bacterium]